MFSYPDFIYDFFSAPDCPSHKEFHAENRAADNGEKSIKQPALCIMKCRLLF